jgi:3-oxoadipate enol-lactonase
LVILPPLGGSAELMETFRRALGPRFETYVIEPPGFGDSPAPSGFPSTKKLAVAALDAWPAVDDAVLFGISLGGMVAQWIAVLAGSRLRGLVLASTAAIGLDALGGLPLASVAGCLVGEGNETLACLVSIIHRDADLETKTLAVDVSREHPRSKHDLVWLAAASAQHDASDVLREVRLPTLVVRGEDDDVISIDAHRTLVGLLPDARQVVLENARHDVTLDAPEALARAVTRFVDELELPRVAAPSNRRLPPSLPTSRS